MMRGEKREAALDGAKLVKNSGRGDKKGDATLTYGDWNFLIDYKHYAKNFGLKKDAWLKHAKDSWNNNHYSPLIKVVFEDNTSVAILDWEDFQELLRGYDRAY